MGVMNGEVKEMKEILEKEEEGFKCLLESGKKEEGRNEEKGKYGEMKWWVNLVSSEKLKKGVDGKG